MKSIDSKLSITAMILAGGNGSRLRNAVSDRQKVVAEVNGRPFLHWLLRQIEQTCITEVILCTGYLAETVKNAVDTYDGKLKISYSLEHSPLGTGGAIVNALPQVKTTSVLIMNGDSFIDFPLSRFIDWALLHPISASIILTELDDVSRYGVVQINERFQITSFREKEASTSSSNYVNAGIYLIDVSLFAEIGSIKSFSIEKYLFPSLSVAGLLYGFPTHGKFIDIGIPESYNKASLFFRSVESQ